MDLKIAVLPGDGIGPEIIEQAIKAIDATCKNTVIPSAIPTDQ